MNVSTPKSNGRTNLADSSSNLSIYKYTTSNDGKHTYKIMIQELTTYHHTLQFTHGIGVLD